MIVEYILVVFKVVLNWDNLLFWCKYHVTNLFITDNSRECFALANQSLWGLKKSSWTLFHCSFCSWKECNVHVSKWADITLLSHQTPNRSPHVGSLPWPPQHVHPPLHIPGNLGIGHHWTQWAPQDSPVFHTGHVALNKSPTLWPGFDDMKTISQSASWGLWVDEMEPVWRQLSKKVRLECWAFMILLETREQGHCPSRDYRGLGAQRREVSTRLGDGGLLASWGNVAFYGIPTGGFDLVDRDWGEEPSSELRQSRPRNWGGEGRLPLTVKWGRLSRPRDVATVSVDPETPWESQSLWTPWSFPFSHSTLLHWVCWVKLFCVRAQGDNWPGPFLPPRIPTL